jgi:hypothetical protein
MKITKKGVWVLFTFLVLSIAELVQANTWTSIPINAYGMDISGINVVGGDQLYNIDSQVLTTLSLPGSGGQIFGIDGDNIVGYYISTQSGNQGVRGFLYDGTTWTTIHKTGASRTIVNDIEGNNLVGTVYDISGTHGFFYELSNSSWTILDKPGAFSTFVNGISGNNIVGQYTDGSGSYGFLYDKSAQTWAILPMHEAFAIDGSYIVGGTQLYNIDTYALTNLDVPSTIYGIDGDNIVGQGFMGVIPEPASILIFGLSALFVSRRCKT